MSRCSIFTSLDGSISTFKTKHARVLQWVFILDLVVVPDLRQGGTAYEGAVRDVSCQGEVLQLDQEVCRVISVTAGKQHIARQQPLMDSIAVMSKLQALQSRSGLSFRPGCLL